MHYKTIVSELLQERPGLCQKLRESGTLKESTEHLAIALKSCHQALMQELSEARPGSHPMQLSSEALELALEELQESLPPESPIEDSQDALSLDAAMEFLHRHTPAA